MKVGLLDIIYIIIIFQLLIFSLFLFVRKAKHLPNYILGIQLFSQAAGISIQLFFNQKETMSNFNNNLFLAGFPFIFLWGPTFYLYVKSAAYTNFRLRLVHIYHFLPFIIVLIFLSITFFPLSSEAKKEILQSNSYAIFKYRLSLDIFLRLQVLFYIILSFFTIKSIKIKLKENYSSISGTIDWLHFLVVGFTIAYVISGLVIIPSYINGSFNSTKALLIILPYSFTLILFSSKHYINLRFLE